MHPAVFRAFDELCAEHGAHGDALEIGAVPAPDTLLLLPALAACTRRVGVNLREPSSLDGGKISILRQDARDLSPFPAGSFDTVLCNSVLEHEKEFWRILQEIRRIARSGALVILGVPGYGRAPLTFFRRLLELAGSLPLPARIRTRLEPALASTPTLVPHEGPGDYYRFSEQACREVLLEGLQPLATWSLLIPPRFIVAGRKP